jgi:hypothetical protein
MSNTASYASARLDGVLDCRSMSIGILNTPDQSTPVVSFVVIAGAQRHPVWALDRLAAVVYCYCLAANSREEQKIELNVSANLVSGASVNCVVASSIHWHTSKLIRDMAENMIADLTSDGSRSWSKRWPSTDIMQLPVTGSL